MSRSIAGADHRIMRRNYRGYRNAGKYAIIEKEFIEKQGECFVANENWHDGHLIVVDLESHLEKFFFYIGSIVAKSSVALGFVLHDFQPGGDCGN